MHSLTGISSISPHSKSGRAALIAFNNSRAIVILFESLSGILTLKCFQNIADALDKLISGHAASLDGDTVLQMARLSDFVRVEPTDVLKIKERIYGAEDGGAKGARNRNCSSWAGRAGG